MLNIHLNNIKVENQGNLAPVFPSFKRIDDDLVEQLSTDMPNVNLGPFQFRKDITTSVAKFYQNILKKFELNYHPYLQYKGLT